MRFCNLLASKQEYNKMNASNIALVLSPNLLWPPNDDITTTMMVSNSVAAIVESMITYVDYFFPDTPEFKIGPPPIQLDKSSGHGRSPSSGSIEAHGTTTVSPSINTTAPMPLGSPSHSRNSSAEANNVSNHNQGENTIQRAKKKKAPPAPTTTPSRTNQTPSVPDSPAGGKPPVASKRVSSKRPSMPPPARPQTGSFSNIDVGSKPTVDASDTPSKPAVASKPAPKPRVPSRKTPPLSDSSAPAPRRPLLSDVNFDDSPPIPEEMPPSVPESERLPIPSAALIEFSPVHDPPMPNYPPPSADANDALGPDLSAELAGAPVVETSQNDKDDEEECQMTQL